MLVYPIRVSRGVVGFRRCASRPVELWYALLVVENLEKLPSMFVYYPRVRYPIIHPICTDM